MSFYSAALQEEKKCEIRVEVARRIKKDDPTKKSVEIIDLKIDKLLSGNNVNVF
jgi:hypothetical protein